MLRSLETATLGAAVVLSSQLAASQASPTTATDTSKVAIPFRYVDVDVDVFVESAASVGLASTVSSRAALWFDGDDDGDLDLYVGYWGGHSPLFVNQGDGTFVEDGADRLPDAARVRESRDAYERVAELAAALEPLLGESTPRFEQLAADSARNSAELLAALEASDTARVEERGKQLTAHCHECNDMDALGGPAKDVFEDARERAGVGDGYYIVGYDLRVQHHDRERLQKVADAMRVAVLLIEATGE